MTFDPVLSPIRTSHDRTKQVPTQVSDIGIATGSFGRLGKDPAYPSMRLPYTMLMLSTM